MQEWQRKNISNNSQSDDYKSSIKNILRIPRSILGLTNIKTECFWPMIKPNVRSLLGLTNEKLKDLSLVWTIFGWETCNILVHIMKSLWLYTRYKNTSISPFFFHLLSMASASTHVHLPQQLKEICPCKLKIRFIIGLLFSSAIHCIWFYVVQLPDQIFFWPSLHLNLIHNKCRCIKTCSKIWIITYTMAN